MTGDPFAHGVPAGDVHTWVRPESPPCPNCECCTAALCELAAAHGGGGWCAVFAVYSETVALCPCSTRLLLFKPSETSKYCARYGSRLGVGDTEDEARADLFAKLTEDERANALRDRQGS